MNIEDLLNSKGIKLEIITGVNINYPVRVYTKLNDKVFNTRYQTLLGLYYRLRYIDNVLCLYESLDNTIKIKFDVVKVRQVNVKDETKLRDSLNRI